MKASLLLFILANTLSYAQTNLTCDQLKALAKTDLEIWNQGDASRLAEIYHPQVTDLTFGYKNLAGRTAFFESMQKEISNLHIDITDLICGDQSITAFYRLTGYNNKYQIPLDISGVFSAKVKEGKYYELRGYFNLLTPLLQAGYTLTPPEPVSREIMMELMEKNLRMFNDKDLSLAAEIFSEDFQNYSGDHLDYKGLAARKAWIQQVFDQTDNLQLRNTQIILGHDSITQEWEATGYNKMYKTDFTTRGISINRVKDGKIYWSSGITDMLTPLTKAGYTLQPPK